MNCVNLKREFGTKYRVRYEESYYAEYGETARREDPRLMIIPCRNGHICPWGGRELAACTRHSGPVASALKALPFATVAQEGDDGCTVVFDAQHLETVAEIMKPRIRRRLSPEERAIRAQRLREYWANKHQVRARGAGKNAKKALSMTSQSSELFQGQIEPSERRELDLSCRPTRAADVAINGTYILGLPPIRC